MQIINKHGNIFDSNAPLLCHQVNCRGVMGAGIAKQIRELYPIVYTAYRQAYESNKLLLGKVIYVSVEDNRIIANLCGQYSYGRSGQYTDYRALADCFDSINAFCKNNFITTIAIPYKMGCGYGGGEWRMVLSAVVMALADSDINVEVWRL